MKINHKRVCGWLVIGCLLSTITLFLLGLAGIKGIGGIWAAVCLAPFILVSPYMVLGAYWMLRSAIKEINEHLDKL